MFQEVVFLYKGNYKGVIRCIVQIISRQRGKEYLVLKVQRSTQLKTQDRL
jgi:hypothetical protein